MFKKLPRQPVQTGWACSCISERQWIQKIKHIEAKLRTLYSAAVVDLKVQQQLPASLRSLQILEVVSAITGFHW